MKNSSYGHNSRGGGQICPPGTQLESKSAGSNRVEYYKLFFNLKVNLMLLSYFSYSWWWHPAQCECSQPPAAPLQHTTQPAQSSWSKPSSLANTNLTTDHCPPLPCLWHWDLALSCVSRNMREDAIYHGKIIFTLVLLIISGYWGNIPSRALL